MTSVFVRKVGVEPTKPKRTFYRRHSYPIEYLRMVCDEGIGPPASSV